MFQKTKCLFLQTFHFLKHLALFSFFLFSFHDIHQVSQEKNLKYFFLIGLWITQHTQSWVYVQLSPFNSWVMPLEQGVLEINTPQLHFKQAFTLGTIVQCTITVSNICSKTLIYYSLLFVIGTHLNMKGVLFCCVHERGLSPWCVALNFRLWFSDILKHMWLFYMFWTWIHIVYRWALLNKKSSSLMVLFAPFFFHFWTKENFKIKIVVTKGRSCN